MGEIKHGAKAVVMEAVRGHRNQNAEFGLRSGLAAALSLVGGMLYHGWKLIYGCPNRTADNHRFSVSGFSEAQIQQACKMAERMEHDAEQELEFPIRYAGSDSLLRIGVFMDDINAPDVYFSSPPALAAQIDA